MKIIVDTPEKLAQLAAQRYVELLKNKPNAVLGYATGSTPLGLYGELARLNAAGEVSFAEATTFNLDEYVGLEGTHDQSYRYFMNKNLFDKIDIKKENTNVPCGIDMTNEKAAQYDKAIEAAGGIDLQLLGIGHNGHIGFNEPGTPFGSVTHVVDLTESTINANARYFDSANDVPRQAISMGIGTIMAARRVILLATGKGKAPAIARAVKGQIDPDMPASILRAHQNCQFLLDEEAASEL